MLVLLLILTFRLKTSLGEKGISCCRDNKNQMMCVRGDCVSLGYTMVASTALDQLSARIYPSKDNDFVESIADRGLEVFQNYTTLIIDIVVSNLNSSSFVGTNTEILSIKSKKINRCAFYELFKLKTLTISGVDNEVNIHKDAFTGLANLEKLEYQSVKTIYTFPVSKGQGNDQIACEHYLCALRNLSTLSMQVDATCDVTFQGIPVSTVISFFSIERYTNKRKTAICPMARHACHYAVSQTCGLRSVCLKESKVGRFPVLLVALIIVGAIVAAVAVGALMYHIQSASGATGPVAVAV